MRNKILSLSLALLTVPWLVSAAPGPITTAGLIEEMTDLAGLAELAQPAYTCKQFSSYDPRSKSPSDPESWFANGDSGHYLRVEERAGRQEFVMMDAAGPGAVVRIWSANPAGTIRIYLDQAEQPTLEAPMADLLGGKFPGLPGPISGEYSRGWNLYFPIPYAKSCKITCDAGKFYYHVNYRTYAAGTVVESFQPAQLKQLASRLTKLVSELSDPRGNAGALSGQGENFELELPPGETVRKEITGAQAITRLVARVHAQNREAALRGIVVKASFDGERCIEAPLGDFFGSAPGLNPFATLPLSMTADGDMYCQWFMPFKENALFELVNYTSEKASLTGEIRCKPYTWSERSLHFHAKWRVQWDVPTRPFIDWNYLSAQGQGLFAGVAFCIDNPAREWWGEGDEKIYVDRETFPSHFGTGTEDYYGYAWCWPEPFTHAYHSQPRCDGPRNYGRTSVNRFHILDRIPFTQDFKFDMEIWHWNQTVKVNLAVIPYWYARPGGTDAFKPIAAADATVRPMPAYQVQRVAGAIEGENMKILKIAGKSSVQEVDGLSDDKHLWWHQGIKPGAQMKVAFPVPKAGKYRVFGRFLTARDYGIHQLAINGQNAGAPVDFYNPAVRPAKERLLGEFELKDGENEFSATAVGANPNALKAYMLGLDYLRLEAVK